MTRIQHRSRILFTLALCWLTLCAAFPLSGTSVVSASEPEIRVFVDGQELTLDVPALLQKGRVLVPMRAIFSALGAQLAWDELSRTAVARRGTTMIEVTVGQPVARVNGQAHTLDVPPQLVSGRVLVPLRFVSESLGAIVGWYGQARVVGVSVPDRTETAILKRVIDGDSLEVSLKGQNVRVQLLGVQAPNAVDALSPIQPFGPQAAGFSRELLPLGTWLQLEVDGVRADWSGQLAVYAYLLDGRMVNGLLVEQGYARAYPFPPNMRYEALFATLESDAAKSRRGLWELDCGC